MESQHLALPACFLGRKMIQSIRQRGRIKAKRAQEWGDGWDAQWGASPGMWGGWQRAQPQHRQPDNNARRQEHARRWESQSLP